MINEESYGRSFPSITVSRNRILYIIYAFLVFSIVFSSNDLLPPSFSWALNKIIYLLLLSFFMALLTFKLFAIRLNGLVVIWLLSCYVLLSLVVSFFNFGILGVFVQGFSEGLVWALMFLMFFVAVDFFSIKKLLFPFLFPSIILFLLSVSIFFGLEVNYQGSVPKLSPGIEETKEGLLFFSGVYINQNSFAEFLFFFISVLLASRSVVISKISLFFLVVFSLSGVFFLISTVSRASILGLCIFLLLLAVGYRYYFRTYVYFLFCFVFLINFAYLFFDILAALITRVLVDGSSGRTEIWHDALSKLYSNPWGGVGSYSYFGLSAHNSYLHKLVSSGVPVFVFWIIFYFLFVFLAIYQILNFRGENRFLVTTLASSFIAICVHQIFETSMSSGFSRTTIYMMFIAAMLSKKQFGSQWLLKFK